jgi:hypothetical protein
VVHFFRRTSFSKCKTRYIHELILFFYLFRPFFASNSSLRFSTLLSSRNVGCHIATWPYYGSLQTHPLMYALVVEHMIDGSCGIYNPKCSCMKHGNCSNNYPKEFNDTTTVDENGFAVYKRPNNQRFVIKGSIKLDNGWIVPHNRAAKEI